MTSPTTLRAGRAGILIVSLGLIFAACSSGAAPATSFPSVSPSAASGSPSAPGAGSEPGNVGSLPPDTPVGGGADPGAGGGGQPPPAGQPQVVRPQPGTIDPREVSIGTLLAQVEDRQVLLNARWWSGVEPCYVLDRVAVSRAGNTFTVALFEGAGQADAMCIEVAVEKVTAIDLGELEPGTYTVEASSGDAEPITVEVT